MDGEEMAPSVLPQAQKVAPISAINVIAKFLPQKKIEQPTGDFLHKFYAAKLKTISTSSPGKPFPHRNLSMNTEEIVTLLSSIFLMLKGQ